MLLHVSGTELTAPHAPIRACCSENSKFLITQCGEPDYQLLVWRWYTGKVGAREGWMVARGRTRTERMEQ